MTPERVQRVAAYVVCLDAQNRILLCRLTEITGNPGKWTLPGGGIEFGEHPAEAAIRELREETGLEGRIGEVAAVDSVHAQRFIDNGVEADWHAIRIIYRAEVTAAELSFEADGTTDLAAWFARDELEAIDLVEVASIGTRIAWDA